MTNHTPEPNRTPEHGIMWVPLRTTPDSDTLTEIADLRAKYGPELPDWPEIAYYGSLTFHMQIKTMVDYWRLRYGRFNSTIEVDENAEKSGVTVIRFQLNDGIHKFINDYRLSTAIVTTLYEGPNGGYIQIRNYFPREFVDEFFIAMRGVDAELKSAVDRAFNRMNNLRASLFTQTYSREK